MENNLQNSKNDEGDEDVDIPIAWEWGGLACLEPCRLFAASRFVHIVAATVGLATTSGVISVLYRLS